MGNTNTLTLVLGATGATGKQLVEQLLQMKQKVKVIVRSIENIPEYWQSNENLTIVQASVSEIGVAQMAKHLQNCDAVASCLGHNLNFKGIYGKPRRLVTDAVKLICDAIKKNKPEKPVRFVLMNTTGNRNRDLNEKLTLGEKLVIGLVSLLLPPQSDNEKAADHLRTQVGQEDSFIEWVAVRPDGLVNEDKVSKYDVYASPIRSSIFNAGITSRINVGNFMARLIIDQELWIKWKGQMPVIYNHENKKPA